MASISENKDQQHPLYNRDRAIVNSLLAGEATDYHLVELARLRIRYHNFPGAKDIQKDLDKLLEIWGCTEAELYQKTREIHTSATIYQGRGGKSNSEDWS